MRTLNLQNISLGITSITIILAAGIVLVISITELGNAVLFMAKEAIVHHH